MNVRSLLPVIAIVASSATLSAQPSSAGAQAKAPYKKELPATLMKRARVTESAAAAAALARVPGGRIASVELEEEDGAFIYSYDITVAGRKGVDEVHVDAMTGAVIKTEHENDSEDNANAEKQEGKQAGKQEPSTTKKPPSKRP